MKSEYKHAGPFIICPQCDGLYLPLGFMRHRAAHRDRRAELAKLAGLIDSGRYDSADLKRYDHLRKLEGFK